jgi:hypothetical protein
MSQQGTPAGLRTALNQERIYSGTFSNCPRSAAPAVPATRITDPNRQYSARSRIVTSAHRSSERYVDVATKANTPPTEMFPHCKKHPSANALVNASQRDNHQLIGKVAIKRAVLR